VANHEATPAVASAPTIFPKFISRKQVCALVGVTYPSLWGWIKAGHFPPGRKLGIGTGNRNKIVWLESEVLEWMTTRPLQLPKGTIAVYGRPDQQQHKVSPEPEPEVRKVKRRDRAVAR
jgi:predicted DNA-binding transcriptional regulator AlpA